MPAPLGGWLEWDDTYRPPCAVYRCQKQCRDENGFKCHQTSEAHLRQMRIFAENPGKLMEKYSAEFEKNFVTMLSRRHGTKRIAANVAYQEYISDKQHVHMNATRWETLSKFVQYLGKSGQCIADETEKGWFIQWIDRDPAAVARQAALDRRRQDEVDDEERWQRELSRRVAEGGVQQAADAPTELQDADRPAVATAIASKRPAAKPMGVDMTFSRGILTTTTSRPPPSKKRRMLDALMHQEQAAKPSQNNEASAWICVGIIVKVLDKQVGEGRYYKKKGKVSSLVSEYVGIVDMLESGDQLQLDEDDLQTVLPALGKTVMILKGHHRGQLASLLAIDQAHFLASVSILQDQADAGRVLDRVEYEHISKWGR